MEPSAILFESDRDDAPGLYVINSDGSDLRLLVPGGEFGEWSPDGEWIAYEAFDEGSFKDALHVWNRESGKTKFLLASDEMLSEWSPDGTLVAFAANDFLDDAEDHRLGVVNVESGQVRRLADESVLGDVSFGRPAWSPDGHWIAVPVLREPEFEEIWIVHPDGSGLRQIGAGERPAWSPDSGRLAFWHSNDDGTEQVVITSVETGVVGPVGPAIEGSPVWGGSLLFVDITWSPDGRTLALSEFKTAADGRIWLIDLPKAQFRVAATATGFGRLEWSSDGRFLASFGSPLLVIEPATNRVQAIAPGVGTGDWHPQEPLVSSYTGGRASADIWVADAVTGRRSRLTRGNRYSYRNTFPSWHPLGLSAREIGGTPAEHAVPEAWLPRHTAKTLRTQEPPDLLAADGGYVAYAPGREERSSDYPFCELSVELWQPSERRLARFAYGDCEYDYFTALALAGERATFSSGDDTKNVYVTSVSVSAPRPVSTNPGLEPYSTVNLAGDGNLTALSASDAGIPEIWRLGSDPTRLGTVKGHVIALAVDAGRVAAGTRDGRIVVFSADGRRLSRLNVGDGNLSGLAMAGRRLVAAVGVRLDVFDVRTGTLLRSFELGPGARLEDAARGVAVYMRGREVHALRLADGRDIVVARVPGGPVRAQIEPAGLFYSYGVRNGTSRGRIAFVPFDAIFARAS